MMQDDVNLLAQLYEVLEDGFEKLEKAYEKKNYEEFREAKESILEIQRKISSILK